ncbi:MAG: hypothetical protein MZV63_67190 [Marinilabiliales bacterium]|nr:hypothetical protein [Marinilabiliales bacterium]
MDSTAIDIFGARLGAYSRNDKLTTEDFEMLVIAKLERLSAGLNSTRSSTDPDITFRGCNHTYPLVSGNQDFVVTSWKERHQVLSFPKSFRTSNFNLTSTKILELLFVGDEPDFKSLDHN